MRISVHARGFELRPELRRFVQSRLSSSLSQFRSRIRLVSVNLAIGIREGLCLPASCDVIATVHPSGEIRVRSEDVHIDVVIAKASERLRSAVEREVSRGPRRHPKRPDRQEHEVWRMPAGEYWKPPGTDTHKWPEQVKEALATT